MTTDLDAIGHELTLALGRRIARRRRSSRRLRVGAFAVAAAGAFSAAALASGIADDLGLDPTKWTVLGRGSVDGGRAEYVHAAKLADDSNSTFLVEHDASLPRYQAFLLHEAALSAGAIDLARPGAGRAGSPVRLRRAGACGAPSRPSAGRCPCRRVW